MVKRTEERVGRTTGPRRGRLNAWLAISGCLGTALGMAPRIALLVVTIWAFTGPVERAPMIAGAAGLASDLVPSEGAVRAGPTFPETGFAVADGPIGNY